MPSSASAVERIGAGTLEREDNISKKANGLARYKAAFDSISLSARPNEGGLIAR